MEYLGYAVGNLLLATVWAVYTLCRGRGWREAALGLTLGGFWPLLLPWLILAKPRKPT